MFYVARAPCVAAMICVAAFFSCEKEPRGYSGTGDDTSGIDSVPFEPGSRVKIHCAPGEIVPELTGPIFPELTRYPRLFFELDDLEELKARKDRPPYAELYASITGTSDREPNFYEGAYSPSAEYSNANIATACAFQALIEGDEQMSQKTALILSSARTEFGPLNYELIDDDIHIAEAVAQYAIAFDILAGSGHLNEVEVEALYVHLESLVREFYDIYVDKLHIFREMGKTNHSTKVVSAIGLGALVFNQSPHAKKWLHYCITKLHEYLDFQYTADGVYAEGPYYHAYSALNHLLFMVALHRLTGGSGGYYYAKKCNLFGTECQWECEFVEDLLTWDKVTASFEARVKMRMPNGTSPPYDDSLMRCYMSGIAASLLNDGVLAWDWANSPACPYFCGWCIDLTVPMYILFDDEQPQTPPDYSPTAYLPAGGVAVFRTGWGEDDTYLAFLAESGKARTHGIGHEHADGLSFMLYSHGEFLALDTGYGSWEQNEMFRYGHDHNLILVDGEGPPAPLPLVYIGGVDAFFTEFWSTDFMDMAAAETSFSGVAHERRILLYKSPKPFALVADHLKSSQQHTYTWILHGMGGGDSGGDFWQTDTGGVWQVGDAYLQAGISSTAGQPAITTRLEEHGFHWREIKTHETLWADILGQDTAYVALLYPENAGTPQLDVEAEANPGAGVGWLSFGIGGLEFLTMVQNDHSVFNGSVEGLNISTKSRFFAYAALDTSPNLVFMDGWFLTIDGIALADAPKPVSVGLQLKGDEAFGYVIPKGAARIDVYVGFEPAEVTGEDVTSWQYLGDGVVRLVVAGDTEFEAR